MQDVTHTLPLFAKYWTSMFRVISAKVSATVIPVQLEAIL